MIKKIEQTERLELIAQTTFYVRSKKSNRNIADFLKNHNSSAALKILEDTIVTGHTGTNIVDLRVILIDS